MKRVVAKLISKLLNFEQKLRQIDVANELLGEAKNDQELHKRVKIFEEIWV